jgi:predicted regulator of Ras-like GTPase activity (Roadblock/LC7/MglB family)
LTASSTTGETTGLSSEARNLQWLLTNLLEEVPGLRSIAVVSSDGLPLLSSDSEERATPGTAVTPGAYEALSGHRGTSGHLATLVSGIGNLTEGAAKLLSSGAVKQTMVTMSEGSLFVMSISDGSLLGAYAAPQADMGVVAYHLGLFVGRAGHVLTPELRDELHQSMEAGKTRR